MLKIPDKKYNIVAAKYFSMLVVGILICNTALCEFALIFSPSLGKIIDSEMQLYSTVDILFAVIFSPILETLILVYCISISYQIFHNKNSSLVFSSIPICLMHIIPLWQLSLIVFPAFYIQSRAYYTLRKNFDRGYCMGFIAAVHATTNAITIILN